MVLYDASHQAGHGAGTKRKWYKWIFRDLDGIADASGPGVAEPSVDCLQLHGIGAGLPGVPYFVRGTSGTFENWK